MIPRKPSGKPEDKDKKPRKSGTMTEGRVFESAVRHLQRYAASSEHLRRIMQRKMKRAEAYCTVPPEVGEWIESAIRRCIEYGYVDDRVYTESRIRILRRQGRSTSYILRALDEKGVPKALIQELLPRDVNSEIVAARRYVERRRLGKDDSFEGRQKDLARLARAGFSLQVARKAFDTPTEDEAFD